jgi:hypothetical protein
MRHAQRFFKVITVSVSLAVGLSAAAKEAPQLSSSLAKNLWRQCQLFFEEGMDARAKRACGELQAWAQENNETEIAREAAELLTALDAREQPSTPVQSTRKEKVTSLDSRDPECGFSSADDIAPHVVVKAVTTPSREFQTCQVNQDCAVARNVCGTNRAINKDSQACYEAMVRKFDQDTGCAGNDPIPATAICHDGTCTLQF